MHWCPATPRASQPVRPTDASRGTGRLVARASRAHDVLAVRRCADAEEACCSEPQVALRTAAWVTLHLAPRILIA